jgi:hypothetical protein
MTLDSGSKLAFKPGTIVNLSNGVGVRIGPNWCVTHLPNGKEVHAHPTGTADFKGLGYNDEDTLTREHDLLHSKLMNWLGAPYSYSLMQAAGCSIDPNISAYEEDAVLKLHILMNALKNNS